MKPIYVLVDVKTGKFWKKTSKNGRRGINSYTSRAKAEATIKEFWPKPTPEDIKIVEYTANETR